MQSDAERAAIELRATYIIEQRGQGKAVDFANMPTDAALRAMYGVKEPRAAGSSRREKYQRPVEEFWDRIDTSGGPDACHPWTGPTYYNHPEDRGCARFRQGRFDVVGCQTRQVTRILVWATYGVELAYGEDVTPICGDHLCANLRHLAVTFHGGGDRRANAAVPLEEYMAKRSKP